LRLRSTGRYQWYDEVQILIFDDPAEQYLKYLLVDLPSSDHNDPVFLLEFLTNCVYTLEYQGTRYSGYTELYLYMLEPRSVAVETMVDSICGRDGIGRKLDFTRLDGKGLSPSVGPWAFYLHTKGSLSGRRAVVEFMPHRIFVSPIIWSSCRIRINSLI
jgi:hypothetical protein